MTVNDILGLRDMNMEKMLYAKKENREVFMEIVELERVSLTPCYDSRWVVKVRNKKGIEEDIFIQRLDIETEENLRRKIEACKTFNEVRQLWKDVYFD